MAETLTIAVCICDEVTMSDFIPPMEILGDVNLADVPAFAPLVGEVPFRFKMDFLAPTMNPVSSMTPGLVTVNPTRTYTDAIEKGAQYDIIWVPAGELREVPSLIDVT